MPYSIAICDDDQMTTGALDKTLNDIFKGLNIKVV